MCVERRGVGRRKQRRVVIKGYDAKSTTTRRGGDVKRWGRERGVCKLGSRKRRKLKKKFREENVLDEKKERCWLKVEVVREEISSGGSSLC